MSPEYLVHFTTVSLLDITFKRDGKLKNNNRIGRAVDEHQIRSLLGREDVRGNGCPSDFGFACKIAIESPSRMAYFPKGVQDDAKNRVMTPSVSSLIKHSITIVKNM